jgi:hypothetical protein
MRETELVIIVGLIVLGVVAVIGIILDRVVRIRLERGRLQIESGNRRSDPKSHSAGRGSSPRRARYCREHRDDGSCDG